MNWRFQTGHNNELYVRYTVQRKSWLGFWYEIADYPNVSQAEKFLIEIKIAIIDIRNVNNENK